MCPILLPFLDVVVTNIRTIVRSVVPVQEEVLRSGSVETLARLVWEGADHPITPAAVHAVANLAANSKQAQHELVEAGQSHRLGTYDKVDCSLLQLTAVDCSWLR